MNRILLIVLFCSVGMLGQTTFDKAKTFFDQAKYNAAQQVFIKLLEVNPNDAKTMEYLGDIAGYTQQWDKALFYYDKLKTSYPQNAIYWYKYGGALGLKAQSVSKFKALGMITDIENAFLTAAKLDPKQLETRWALVVFYIQLPSFLGGSELKSQKFSNELMALSPVDGFLAKGYIDVHYKRYVNAEKNCYKAYQIGHSKTAFKTLYDLYLNKLNDPQKASKLKNDFIN